MPFYIVEVRQHFAQLIHAIGRHALGLVLFVEQLEAFMDEIPYFHR